MCCETILITSVSAPGRRGHPGHLLRGPEAPPGGEWAPLAPRPAGAPVQSLGEHLTGARKAAQLGEAEGGNRGGPAAPRQTAPGQGALGARVSGQRKPAGGAGEQTGGEGKAVPAGSGEAQAGEGRAGRTTGGVPAEPGAAQGGPEEREAGTRASGGPGKAAPDLEARAAEQPACCHTSHDHPSGWAAGEVITRQLAQRELAH